MIDKLIELKAENDRLTARLLNITKGVEAIDSEIHKGGRLVTFKPSKGTAVLIMYKGDDTLVSQSLEDLIDRMALEG